MDSSAMWGDQEDPTLSAPHEDFQQFLDMSINSLSDSLHFDFPEFDGHSHVQLQQSGVGSMDTHMDGQDHMHQMKDVVMQEQHLINPPGSNHSTIPNTPIDGMHRVHGSHESLVELDAQIQYLQQQRQQQQQRVIQEQQRNYYAQNSIVPPTPNSIEMHGGASSFYMTPESQQQQQYNRFQMSFTPLVSPAVTPLETHFLVNDFTMPGAYFSPLSSPALHAQNEHRTIQEARHSENSATTSPVDFNNESQTTGGTKKSARKPAAKPRNPRVRQSPIVKPQRRKGGSTVIPPQALKEIVEPASQTQPESNGSGPSVPSTDVSENGSISPEHLSDMAMAPPPLPQPASARGSPYMISQAKGRAQSLSATGGGLSPATPASLMRLMKPPSSGEQQSPAMPSQSNILDDQIMDDFALPEAASTHTAKPQLSRIDTTSGQTTPTMNPTSKTTGFQPLPSPAFIRPTIAASQSPRICPTPDSTSSVRKTPNLLPRGTKKRGSVSSVHVSPALRPKISPSIKPLFPGGSSVSDDTASLLLTSKSNYQNILEGTHLPGVSYPTELSTNLTSKRTSHKIAEQGRRNRINSALQEIATMLPKNGKDSGAEKSSSGDGAEDSKESKAAQTAGSKASTVEQAIEYIKQLKQQVEEANKRAEEAEKKLADVKI